MTSSRPSQTARIAFFEALRHADRLLLEKSARLERLSASRSVLLYGFGTRGRSLAPQLGSIGVVPVIFDTQPTVRASAAQAGYETVESPDVDLPLIVAAAQNQSAILECHPGGYSLVECQYSYDLANQCDCAREFTSPAQLHPEEAFSIYEQLDDESQRCFLDLLCFRFSLDVSAIRQTRMPLSTMWALPLHSIATASFCDVGAYDGDSIEALSKLTPLREVLAIEPNPALAARILEVATSREIQVRVFSGAAWSHPCQLAAKELLGGMVAVEESDNGTIAAEPLDAIASHAYDYVKFDVEGSEDSAIAGATRTIVQAKAVAMASYHKPRDVLDLPARLARMRADSIDDNGRRASLHFRHYSECFDDSVFYHF
ncbi:MAG: FkbM family methyltransferase [Alphaproteobacteria bacterium]|nr:FkbM family methyltransferase [Alphaproteobacteria bacterium]